MKPRQNNRPASVFLRLILLAFMVVAAFRAAQADASEAPEPDKIQITADRLVADQNSQFVLFSGNVKAVQGKTTIFSDSLKIYYRDSQIAPGTYDRNAIDKIFANGNVRIVFEDKTAFCEQAVYITETEALTLSGEGTRIESADNFISGEKITIYQLTGQIIVDGSEGKKVQAIFHPAEDTPMPDLQ